MKNRILCLATALLCALSLPMDAAQPKKPAAVKPAPPKISNLEVSRKLNGIYDKYSERIQNTDMWKRDFKKIQAEYADFLKNPDLTEDQRISVLSRMISNGLDMGNGEYERQLAALEKCPDSPAKLRAVYDIINGHIKSRKRWRFKLVAPLAEAYEAKFSPDQQISLYSLLGNAALSMENDPAKFNALMKKMQAVPISDDLPERARKNLAAKKNAALRDGVLAMIKYNDALGKELFNKCSAQFGEAENLAFRQAFLNAAIEAQDRQEFDSQLAEIRKFPFSEAKFNAFLNAAKKVRRRSMPVSTAILEEVAGWRELTPEMTLSVLMAKVSMADCPTGFDYGAYSPKAYERAKAALLEAENFAVAHSAELEKSRILKDFYKTALAHYYAYGDFALFEKTLAEARKRYPDDMDILERDIANSVRTGNKAAAIELTKGILANPKMKYHHERKACVLIFLENPADKAISLCNRMFDEKGYPPAKRLDLFRETSRYLFNLKQFDDARTIHNYIFAEMFKAPPIGRTYTVNFMEDAPQSADSWAKSKFYDQWDAMETRFYTMSQYDVDGSLDKKNFLKGAPEQPLDDAYRMGVHIVCTPDGVHFYIRGNDPKIDEVRLGIRKDAGTLEATLRPDDSAAYHWWNMANLPKVDDPYVLNWAGPSKHYRLTYDYLKKDAVLTREGFVVHNFVPWAMCYDKLPFEGHRWAYGLVAFTPSPRTISGKNHEFSRTLQLNFDLTPAQIAILKKRLALYLYNRYAAIRADRGDVIWTWADDVLGDPDFYKAEVEPLVNELDAAGKKLQTEFNTISDAEVNEIYRKYVPIWAEIKYVLADKRAAYLKKQLLK